MYKNDLIKISVDKELNVSIEVDGNPAEILAALGTVMQDILNGISAETGVGYDYLAKAYCRHVKEGNADEILDSLEEDEK